MPLQPSLSWKSHAVRQRSHTGKMEQLIAELHNTSGPVLPARVDEIQKQIQGLQRAKSAWQLGLDLLHHAEPIMRFYGALTLTIKINADW